MGNYTVKVLGGAVNVEAGTLDIKREIGQRSTCAFTAWTNPGVVWQQGAHVEVYDGAGTLVYGGYVQQDTMTKPGYGPYMEHAVECADYHYLADKRLCAGSWLFQTAGGIVASIYNTILAEEGVTIGGIAQGIVVQEAVYEYEQVSKIFDDLAAQCGFWWSIDIHKQLWFQPYGGQVASWTMDGTMADNLNGAVSVVVGNRDFRTAQYMKGGFDSTPALSESFHGDGATRAFTLRYQLSGVPTVTLNGVTQTLGTKGVDSGKQWYYARGDAVIAQDSSGTPLGAGDTLTVSYKGRYPVMGYASNPSLVSAQATLEGGGTGLVEVKYDDTKVHTATAAIQIAGNLLNHYAQSMTVLTFATLPDKLPGPISEGNLLTVTLPDFGISEQMLVRALEIGDRDGLNIWYTIEAIGSPYDVSWQTFFQGLVNQQAASNTDLQNTEQAPVLATIGYAAIDWGWQIFTTAGGASAAIWPSPTLAPGPTTYPC